ncbi:hypothetical protein [Ekhidna sp.]|uniref:hypothetical protein n=1 Tax=Ekhidna sp. TaxID=2608089 RepID=UPI003B5153BE
MAWLVYHLTSFIRLPLVFHPFPRSNRSIPMVIIPSAGLISFIFLLVSALLIYAPLILIFLNALVSDILVPELLIVSLFGLIIGTIFRYIQGSTSSVVRIDPRTLTLIFYRLKGKVEQVFDLNDAIGLVHYREKYRGTKNHKICIAFEDGHQVLLKLTIFEKKARKLLSSFEEVLNLKEMNPPKRSILNDGQVTLSN